jgi:hypothetical protein
MDDFKAYILSSRIANEKSADFYVHWVTGFYRHCSKNLDDTVTREVIDEYLAYLRKRKEDWQVRQASDAIQLFLFFKNRKNRESCRRGDGKAQWKTVAEEMRHTLRLRHRAARTEEAYPSWLRKFYLFLNGIAPYSLDSGHVKEFMTYLAVEKNVAESTLTLQKLRMLQIRGVKGEAVVYYCEPLTTKEMRYPRLSLGAEDMTN